MATANGLAYDGDGAMALPMPSLHGSALCTHAGRLVDQVVSKARAVEDIVTLRDTFANFFRMIRLKRAKTIPTETLVNFEALVWTCGRR